MDDVEDREVCVLKECPCSGIKLTVDGVAIEWMAELAGWRGKPEKAVSPFWCMGEGVKGGVDSWRGLWRVR